VAHDGNASASFERTTEHADRIDYPRAVDENPPETQEIKPHPYGVELGNFLRMLKNTEEKQLGGFFKNEFCRVTPAVVKRDHQGGEHEGQVLQRADLGQEPRPRIGGEDLSGAAGDQAPQPPHRLPGAHRRADDAGGMLKGVKAEFYAASTRSPRCTGATRSRSRRRSGSGGICRATSRRG
jgi:DNA topoisomerase VI subunit B